MEFPVRYPDKNTDENRKDGRTIISDIYDGSLLYSIHFFSNLI